MNLSNRYDASIPEEVFQYQTNQVDFIPLFVHVEYPHIHHIGLGKSSRIQEHPSCISLQISMMMSLIY